MLAQAFIGRGHEVTLAVDGEEGWTLFQAHGFHLVVTDWQMPRLDGAALASRIRASGYDVPIIIETSDPRGAGEALGPVPAVRVASFADLLNELEGPA